MAFDLDTARATARISAGFTYAALARRLHERGFALRNLGSLRAVGVDAACATAPHGSGDAVGNLATAVSALEMVPANGDVVMMSREADGDEFSGAVVALGSLGVVTSLSLDLVPAFEVRQHVYDDLQREQVDDHLAAIFSAAYSVSLFTDWRGHRVTQAWLKHRVADGGPAWAEQRWHGGRLADGPRHPVPGMSPVHATRQLGAPGPWHERLPHFLADFTPSPGSELQSEYLLPRELARDAIRAIDQVRDMVAPVVQISEIRTVAADDLWMSPSYRRDTVGIHFTWIDDLRAVGPAIAAVEGQLAPFRPRPHWGKLFSISPQVVRGLYPRLSDFQRLVSRYDPAGKFRNDFLDPYIAAT